MEENLNTYIEAKADKLLEDLTEGERHGDCIGSIAEQALREALEEGARQAAEQEVPAIAGLKREDIEKLRGALIAHVDMLLAGVEYDENGQTKDLSFGIVEEFDRTADARLHSEGPLGSVLVFRRSKKARADRDASAVDADDSPPSAGGS